MGHFSLHPQSFLHSPHCQKSYNRKILASYYRYGGKVLVFLLLEGDFLHSLMLEKLRPENPG